MDREWFDSITEFIADLASAWPLAVVVIVIILSWRFRTELGELIARVVRVNSPAASIDFNQPLPQLEQQTDAEDVPESPTDQAELQAAFNEIARRYAFEIIYRLIFGSQIAALRAANSGLLLDIKPFYERHVELVGGAFPNYQPTLQGWSLFLIQRELIQHDDAGWETTQLGRDFLVYLTQMQIPELKPY
jgi:hypothetical protein